MSNSKILTINYEYCYKQSPVPKKFPANINLPNQLQITTTNENIFFCVSFNFQRYCCERFSVHCVVEDKKSEEVLTHTCNNNEDVLTTLPFDVSLLEEDFDVVRKYVTGETILKHRYLLKSEYKKFLDKAYYVSFEDFHVEGILLECKDINLYVIIVNVHNGYYRHDVEVNLSGVIEKFRV